MRLQMLCDFYWYQVYCTKSPKITRGTVFQNNTSEASYKILKLILTFLYSKKFRIFYSNSGIAAISKDTFCLMATLLFSKDHNIYSETKGEDRRNKEIERRESIRHESPYAR
ncbi:hypothetical protein V1478_013428 [Vespula squamosa]|uniref:Uncharacterized protein n=1 Tax=Vespula squamosa TaxID=30214 RepID=A0ABD2AAU2_VESSQ